MGLTCKGEAKADQETSANEHGDRLGNSLNGGHNTHDRCAQPDGSTTTKAISNIGAKRILCQSANTLRIYGQRVFIRKGACVSLGWH